MKIMKKDKIELKMLSKSYKEEDIKKIRGLLMEGYSLKASINKVKNGTGN